MSADIKIEPWAIKPNEEERFRAGDETFGWLCNLPREMLDRYSGKWVAAKDCEIVASGDSLDELLQQLIDVDLESVIVDHIERPSWMIYR